MLKVVCFFLLTLNIFHTFFPVFLLFILNKQMLAGYAIFNPFRSSISFCFNDFKDNAASVEYIEIIPNIGTKRLRQMVKGKVLVLCNIIFVFPLKFRVITSLYSNPIGIYLFKINNGNTR